MKFFRCCDPVFYVLLVGMKVNLHTRIVALDTAAIKAIVVYFDQQTGALHAIGWSKSFFSALKQVFLSFSITNSGK